MTALNRPTTKLAGALAAGATLLACLVLLTPMLEAQGPPLKIGVVNLDLIVASSPAGRALQSKLETFQRSVQAEGEAKTASAQDIRQRIADGANTLSEEKLSELQKELEDAQIAIRRYRDDKQREGEKMQAEGLREIEQQLEPVFRKIRDEEGYDLILNNVPGVVVMIGPRVDLTQTVLDHLGVSAIGSS